MTSPRLNLIVIRSLDTVRLVAFYQMLGISFVEEQHGSGPVHCAADLDGLVLEVYPAKTADEVNKTIRLGFEIEDVAATVNALRASGVEIANDVKQSQWGLRAVVRDCDGRTVELVQRA